MPRIKGLTTGSIPGFVDIALNLDSKALVEDNVITQMYRAGRRIVFYGDDTWLKLFPEHFVRHDGTTSFFVTDYTEVDQNVTRHVVPELSRPDWDVMILHYLGLDHIGHLAGPTSSLIGLKLQEMDTMVETIHSTVVEQDSERALPTLLVLCGDHGMSNAGSHGGASAPETLTTLLFLSSLFSEGKGSSHVTSPVYQTGLAPTLALTFGVPVPQNSLGQVMTPVLARSSSRDQLQAVQINAYQLVRVLQANVPGYNREAGYQLYQQAVKMHSGWLKALVTGETAANLETLGQRVTQQYRRAMEKIVDRVSASLSEYDMHAMAVGIALLVQVSSILIAASGKFVAEVVPGTDSWMVYIPSPILLLSSFFLVLSAQVSVCTSATGWASAELCSGKAGWFMSFAAVTFTSVCVSLTIQSLFLTNWRTLLSAAAYGLHMCCSLPWETMFLLMGVGLHTVSLGSSSLVEEEHQTWYFLQTTLFLLLMCSTLQALPSTTRLRHSLEQDTDVDKESDIYKQRISLLEGEQKYDHRKEKTDKESSQAEEKVQSECGLSTREDCVLDQGFVRKMVAVLALLVTSRLLRSWNQTGIVSADRPDIGDWFVRPENKMYLSLLVAASFFTTFLLRWRSCSFSSSFLLGVGLIGVYHYRGKTGVLAAPWVLHTDKGILEARLVYLVIIIQLCWTCVELFKTWCQHLQTVKDDENLAGNRLRDHVPKNNLPTTQSFYKEKENLKDARKIFVDGLLTTFVLSEALLLRPHNATVLAVTVFQQYVLHELVLPWTTLYHSVPLLALVHVWMGQAAFYFQGNSNSIATIDISAGYVGMEDYVQEIAGTLTCLSTYAGPLLWFTSLLVLITKKYPRPYPAMLQACFAIIITRTLPVTGYTVITTLQRYHLFVWSVFSPKLLYEGMLTAVTASVVVLMLCLGVPLHMIGATLDLTHARR
ncbi:PREDICTED: GPI ethanolamine phosphate transferase 2-like [Branchiostoma belcheri]|uniref:GPI ethanolamine phosphate transferase 2-like n=1 Tax=Branchiostoma belcheri TaxID=7741 RepID=A0A6P4ZBW5_BRABE|nr:PREDICTED: GPI ethanolamine phosphate transferase 2-like [Branchiostoma belcheri]